MRIIYVERCSPEECPYCIPDSYRRDTNYCNGFVNSKPSVNVNIKTFPKICPLENEERKK